MIESKNYQKLFNSWRRYDIMATVFSIAGLLLAMINYELDVYNNNISLMIDNNGQGEIQFDEQAVDSRRFKQEYT